MTHAEKCLMPMPSFQVM